VQAGPNLVPGIWNSLMDLDRTRVLVWDLYRYARLFDVDSLDLEPTTANIAGNLSFPYLGLGEAYRQRGHVDSMLMNYRRAQHLSPTPELEAWLKQFDVMQKPPIVLPGSDTAGARGARDTARRTPARR